MPASLAVLASVEVEYVTLPGWTEPIASCKVCVFGAKALLRCRLWLFFECSLQTFAELPKNAQDYVML